ncbi:MAG TPA: general secretion pathway protein GspB [Steroidobacteraceae bacterium]|nr:general secretion pathway protein GspB [Steroidobacteraceae bacterium]
MSFILDALKKSETDRQRQSGPALFEVKVTPPRARLPLWALAIAALLAVNLGIVAWIVLRHPEHAGSAPSAPSPALMATTPPVAPPPVQPVSAANTPAPDLGSSAGIAAPPAPPQPPLAAGAAPGSTTPSGGTSSAVASSGAAPSGVPPSAAAAAATAATAAAVASGSAASGSANPEDYAPAEPASTGLGSHVRRGTAAGVPLYQEAAATTQLPQLRLDLHVFSPAPQDRFVMINMHRLREGDSLPEGVHVESITPEGAVLSYNGSKFLLPRD